MAVARRCLVRWVRWRSGASATVIIIGTVADNAGDELVNTATVFSSTLDPNPNNNNWTISTPVAPLPGAESVNIQQVSGGEQAVLTGNTETLTVQVLDDDKPLEGIEVQWVLNTNPAGQGRFSNGQSTITVDTDNQGRASTNVVTDPAVDDPAAYTVTASASVRLPDGSEASDSVTFEFNIGLEGAFDPGTPGAAVGASIDRICPELQLVPNPDAATSNLADRCDELERNPNDPGTQVAVNQIAPDDVGTQQRLGKQFALGQLGNIGARIRALQLGATGFSSSGLAVSIDGTPVPLSMVAALRDAATGGSASADDAGLLGQGWGVFVNGNISFGDRDPNQPGKRL